MQFPRVLLFFVLFLFYLNLLEIEANDVIYYEIKALCETDMSLFTKEAYLWDLRNSKSEDTSSTDNFQIENSTLPKLILWTNNTNTTETQSFVFKTAYWVLAPHKYAIGSLRFWYSDDDFSDGSRVTLEIYISQADPQMMEQQKEPCFRMNIPSPEKQFQSHSEFIYFGVSHNSSEFYINVKFSIYSNESNLVKPKSLGLRDLTIHLSNESQAVKYSQAKCPLGQGLNENLICQDCAANCEACFGPKPSQCLSCSPGSHWHGLECTTCHNNCDKCSGPTEHECLDCNFQLYDYRNGSCLEWCDWPFKSSEMSCLKACKSDEYVFKSHADSFCSQGCAPPLTSFIDNNGILICENPCWNSENFLYADGSCISVCPDLFTREYSPEGRFCKSPCESTSDYLFTNRSCAKECPPSWKIRSEPEVNYCEDPCQEKYIYHYNNGSCLPICPYPFEEVFDQGVRYCKTLCESASDYLYFNRSCLKECPSPLKVRLGPAANYCVNPCDSVDGYLYQNGSCLSNCLDPLRAQIVPGIKYCKNPCELASDYLYANRSCLKECPTPLKVISESIANYCVNPCESEGLYLYQNGSCILRCPPPLVAVFESGVTFCRNPCRQSSDYLYHNRNCFKECPFPLQIRTESIANFCINPCHSTNLYLYQNGSCLTCKAPLVVVFEDEIRYCRNPCNSTSDYLYANRSCLKECSAPLMMRSESIAKFCVNPCAKLNLYLYRNGSCLSTCPFPLKPREEFGVKYCEPPCNLAGEYILKDGSCSADCPVPLIQKIKMSVGTFCLSPCQSNDYFLVRNESCVFGCPRNFESKVQYEVKYCKPPCFDDQYYFPQNRSCLDLCPYPFKIAQEEGISLCSDPCSNSDDFIYDDGECRESCLTPLRIEEGKYCKSPCLAESQYVNSDGSCQESCEHPGRIVEIGRYKICQIGLKRTQSAQIVAMREIIEISNTVSWVGGVLSCLMDAGDPTSILIMPLLEMFQIIIDIEVKLPRKTKFILGQLSPEDSEQRIFSSSFDERVVMMAIFSVITLLISGLLKVSSHESKFYQLLEKIDVVLRWNTLIPLLISISGNQQFQLESPRGILCILLIIFVIRKIFKVSQRGREEDNPRWKFLFEIFSENQRFFILIFFLRVIAIDLLVGLLKDYSRFQAFSMMLLSCGMCFYVVWLSPMKKSLSKVQYMIVELTLLLYNLIFWVLAVSDLSDGLMVDIFGQLMNILYLITSVITAIIIIFKIIHTICKAYNSSRASQSYQIQLSEMNQESDFDLPSESLRFERLNHEDENNIDLEDDSIEPSIAIE